MDLIGRKHTGIKIRSKILFLTIIGIITFLVFSAGAFVMGKNQIRSLEELYQKNVVPLDRLRHIQLIFREIEFRMAATSAQMVTATASIAHLHQAEKDIDRYWRESGSLLNGDNFLQEKEKFEKGYKGFKEMIPNFSQAYEKIFYDEELGPMEDAYDKWLDYKPLIFKSIDNIVDLLEESLKNNYIERKKLINKVRFVAVSGSLIVTALFVVFTFFIIRSINRPIETVVEAAKKVANGDLTCKINLNSQDEMGVMASELNTMIEKLSQTFVTITDEAERLFVHAEGLSGVSDLLVSGSESQKVQTEQVIVATNQMTEAITNVGKNASDASEVTRVSYDSASSGSKVVEETKSSIAELANSVDGASEAIVGLGSSSKRIGEIVSVIQDIADQTNLLALNAAIESARAGEQGRGFAVVADEVRKLAERTTQATGEVTDIIRTIQKETDDVISSLEQGKSLTDRATRKADEAGESHQCIVKGSENVMDMVQNIASATEEQSAASHQVTQNMQQIAGIIDQTFMLSGNIKSVSSELTSVASQLKAQVESFRTNSLDMEMSVSRTSEIADLTDTNKAAG